MPQSSTVWWSSICRSPVAATRMSMRLWRASWSSMWSKNPTPVDMSAFPVPSRSTSTEIRVSVVSRSIFAVRMRFSRCVWCLIGAPDAGSKRLDPRSHHRLCGRTRQQHRHGGAVFASRGGGGAGGGYGTGELSLAGRAGGVGGIHAPGRDRDEYRDTTGESLLPRDEKQARGIAVVPNLERLHILDDRVGDRIAHPGNGIDIRRIDGGAVLRQRGDGKAWRKTSEHQRRRQNASRHRWSYHPAISPVRSGAPCPVRTISRHSLGDQRRVI